MTLNHDITKSVIINRSKPSLSRHCEERSNPELSCFWIASYLAMTKVFQSESSYKCATYEKRHYKRSNPECCYSLDCFGLRLAMTNDDSLFRLCGKSSLRAKRSNPEYCYSLDCFGLRLAMTDVIRMIINKARPAKP
jgi:hypothetical protein